MSRLGATYSVKIRSYERENVLGQYVELEKGGGVYSVWPLWSSTSPASMEEITLNLTTWTDRTAGWTPLWGCLLEGYVVMASK